MPVKYLAAAIILLVAASAVMLAGSGFHEARRAREARQHTLTLKAALAAESTQELARHYAECFPATLSAAPVNRDPDYCLEVERATDERPLEAVSVPGGPAPALPQGGGPASPVSR
jgi:hypothetical protein